jgi:hypothetical protein
MSILSRASVAQMVVALVARRKTKQDELPQLVESVHLALAGLGRAAEPEEFDDAPAAVAPALRARRRRRISHIADAPPSDDAMSQPAPAPRLVRRAEIVHAPANGDGGLLQAAPGGVLRGIVKWFDQRARRGALRLPGHSGDVPVEPALLEAMAISRLYKGQEVDATLSDEATPRVVQLSLPNGGWNVSRTGGVVHNRHAKPVVVELKREALRRVAARVEAELLLGPGRAR